MNKIIKKLSFSLPWDQRIAEIISKPFIFFNIHPNIVTIIGALLGLIACCLYTTGDIFYAKIASIIFFFAACFFAAFHKIFGPGYLITLMEKLLEN